MKNIGVIGCGGRIQGVLDCIPGIGKDIRIAAIFDPQELSIKNIREKFNLTEVKVCGSYQELVALPELDWVFIGSWNCFHPEQAEAALRAGKDVFCEKPLATKLEDCARVIRAWKESGRQLSMGFTLRYSPHYRRIQKELASGCVGKIISFEFNETLGFNHGGYIHGDWRRLRKNAGTHLLEKCCHDIDLVNWFVGSPAARVASFGGCDFFTPENVGYQEKIGKSPEGKTAYQSWPNPRGVNPFTGDKDIVDNQVAIIEYASHVRATFHTNCHAALPERRLYVCGTEGTLRADLSTGNIEIARIGWDTTETVIDTHASGGHGGGDEVLGQSLRASILEGKPPFTSTEDGVRATVTALAIDQACDTGQVVDLAAFWQQSGL